MALLSLAITFLTLLALPLCGAPVQISLSTPAQAQQTSAAPITTPPAPTPPTLGEMRDMTVMQLDEAGDQLRHAKDYRSAILCYRQAIRKHASAAYYNKIAISELLLMHPAEAEKAAKKAVHKDKRMAEAWNNLAVSYYMRNRYEMAIRCYQWAILLKPNFASFHNNLAAAFMDSKQFERGMTEYRKAFEIDPSFFEHPSQNGVSAHMSSPKDRAQFSFVMARLFAGNGDLDRALHFLRAAIEDGYPSIDDVYRDQEFTSVRKDERFQALMKERPPAVH